MVSSVFSQPHFVGQNAVDAVFVERDHPIDTANLIITHLPACDVVRRLVGSGLWRRGEDSQGERREREARGLNEIKDD